MSSGDDDLNDDSSSSHKQYTFTIDNGVVTAYFEVENGITERESIDSRDSFVINGNQITHTKQTSDGPEVTIFSDPDADGFYRVTSDSNDDNGRPGDGDHKAYKFTVENGRVVAAFERDDGVWEQESIDDDGTETYTVESNGDVTRTEVKPFGTEITRYSDTDGDLVFNRVSEQWQNGPNAPGSGHFVLEDNLRFSHSDDDDLIAVRRGEDCRGGGGADDFVIREAAHLRIADFNGNEDDTLVFDTGLGLTSVQHLIGFVTNAHYVGEDLIVEFGSDVSITIVGLQPDQASWDNVSVLS